MAKVELREPSARAGHIVGCCFPATHGPDDAITSHLARYKITVRSVLAAEVIKTNSYEDGVKTLRSLVCVDFLLDRV